MNMDDIAMERRRLQNNMRVLARQLIRRPHDTALADKVWEIAQVLASRYPAGTVSRLVANAPLVWHAKGKANDATKDRTNK